MKTIQPLQLSLLTKNHTFQQKNHLVITSMLGFPLSGGRPLLESDLWTKLAEALGDSVLDIGMSKLNGEVLVYANYYAPKGEPVTAGRAVLQCGSVDKELAVIGNRYWRALLGPTAPEPFKTMPLNYEHAFGGEKYDKNPLGMGMQTVDVLGEQRTPLPNIEDPDKLMSSEGDRPDPAGFAPLDIAWQQRLKRSGTYDQKWIEKEAPAYPHDIDWHYFNSAPADQWIKEFWQGDESYNLYNMHPEQEVLQGKLPGFRGRSFLVPRGDNTPTLKEVDQRLETIYFFPEQDLGVLLWRGEISVVEDDMSDMLALVSVFEDMHMPAKTLEHYQQAYDNREDPEQQLKYLNNTEDLIPERVPCGHRYITVSEEDMAMPLLENIFAGAEQKKNALVEQANQKIDELKVQLEGMKDKLQPDVYKAKMDELNKPIVFPEFKVPSKADRLKALEKEQLTERVDLSKLETDIKGKVEANKNLAREKLVELREEFKEKGLDDEKLAVIDEAMINLDLPPVLPRPSIDEMRVQLDIQLADIEVQKQLILDNGGDVSGFPVIDIDFDAMFIKFKQLETMKKEGYRLSAHVGELGRHPHTRPLSEVREELLQAFANGESLKERDFACIDLSGQNLSGINLEGAYLEQVNFSGAVLNNANLQGAILAGANLSGVSMYDANLSRANLGKVNFSKAEIKKTNLKQAIVAGSVFGNTCLTECDLSQTDTTDAQFSEVNFSNSIMSNFTVNEIDLSSCKFEYCQLNDASFIGCQLNHSSFRYATMHKASFSECQSEYADFSQADLLNARFQEECVFKQASFTACNLDRAVFHGGNFEDARFDEASFFMADFSGSNLQRASFHRAIGKKAQFVRSDLGSATMTSMNLMEGTLMKARLTLADFSDSNLYAVEFMNATVGETNFSGANLDMSKLENWNP